MSGSDGTQFGLTPLARLLLYSGQGTTGMDAGKALPFFPGEGAGDPIWSRRALYARRSRRGLDRVHSRELYGRERSRSLQGSGSVIYHSS